MQKFLALAKKYKRPLTVVAFTLLAVALIVVMLRSDILGRAKSGIKFFAQAEPVESKSSATSVKLDKEDQEKYAYLDGPDVSNGNPVSWSGRLSTGEKAPAVPVEHDKDPLQPYESNKKSPVVIQGHTVPLAGEMLPSIEEYNSRYQFDNAEFSPECCPSSYSSDNGCLCEK